MAEILEDRTLLSSLPVTPDGTTVTVELPDVDNTDVNVTVKAGTTQTLVFTGSTFDSTEVDVSSYSKLVIDGGSESDSVTLQSMTPGVEIEINGNESDGDSVSVAGALDLGALGLSIAAEQIALESGSSVVTTGSVSLVASHVKTSNAPFVKLTTATTSITVADSVSINGGDVTLSSSSRATTDFFDSEDPDNWFSQNLSFLNDFNLVGGWAESDASASVTIGESVSIVASGQLEVSTYAKTTADVTTVSIAVGMGYARSVPQATLNVGDLTSLAAGGSIVLASDAFSELDVQVSDALGVVAGSVIVAVGHSEGITSTVTVGNNVDMDAVEDVVMSSTLVRDHNVFAKAASLKGGQLGIGAAFLITPDVTVGTSIGTSTTVARIEAGGDVRVVSGAETIKNSVTATAQVGEDFIDRAKNKLKRNSGAQASMEKLEKKITGKDATPEQATKVKFGAAVALSYLDDSVDTAVEIGSGVILDAETGDVVVLSQNRSNPFVRASATVNSFSEKDANSIDDDTRELAGGVGVAIGLTKTTASTTIHSGAVLDGRNVQVGSEAATPLEIGLIQIPTLADYLSDVDTRWTLIWDCSRRGLRRCLRPKRSAWR